MTARTTSSRRDRRCCCGSSRGSARSPPIRTRCRPDRRSAPGGCGGSERASGTEAAAAEATASRPSASPTRCSRKTTPAQTEGPYFKAGSPSRASLLQGGLRGTRLVLTGRVLTSRCSPLTGVRLDFWQANAKGVYDNSGYRLRGHQSTGPGGRFTLTTIVLGEYAGRTEHIHVKVSRPGRSTLTTQLYFPGVARNDEDGIFDARLLMNVRDMAGGKRATFDFVLPACGRRSQVLRGS